MAPILRFSVSLCGPLGAALGVLLVGAPISGCERASATERKPAPVQPAAAASESQLQAGTTAQPAPKPKPTPKPLSAGQVIAIPAGELRLGSVPGSVGRDASREADHVALQLPAFSIDRLPYPNDPAQPPLTNISRDEAAQKCSDAGKRLCSEQEWERACKGEDDHAFPMGSTWNISTCGSDPTACDSDFGVSALGTSAREWTASVAETGIGVSTRTAVTRGSTSDTPAAEHRCAARNAATPDSRSTSIGFRCCQGEVSDAMEATYPIEAARPLVEPLELNTEALRETLKAIPELADYAATFTPMTRTGVSRALARGGRGADNVTLWTLTPAVFTWSPMRGEAIVVISGHVADDSVLLAALYPHEGRYLHGASVVLHDKDSSVAIGAREDEPTSLLWTSCWGCYGEGGRLGIGADGRVSFQFR